MNSPLHREALLSLSRDPLASIAFDAEWTRSGWDLLPPDEWMRHPGDGSNGLLARKAFTRGAGATIAVADAERPGSGRPAVLTAPDVRLDGRRTAVLEFDEHLRLAGNAEALVEVAFDDRDPVVVRHDRAGAARGSSHAAITIDVPAGVFAMTVRWSFLPAPDPAGTCFWAVAEVEVHAEAWCEPGTPRGAIDVVSDIQGDLDDLADSVRFFERCEPASDALLMVGDLVAHGTAQNWADLRAACDRHPHPSGRRFAALGNHELYGPDGHAAMSARFLEFAGRDTVWGETEIAGLPVLAIGSEAYDYRALNGAGPFVAMSARQFAWLRSRLEHWAAVGSTVLLLSHHPLPCSVAGSHLPFSADDYLEQAELEALLGAHPNVVMLSGHTHWDLGSEDAVIRRRVPGGDPRGFAIVSTGALELMYGLDDDGVEVVTGQQDEHQAVRLVVFDDRIRVEGWDVKRRRMLRSTDLPIALAARDASASAVADRA
ncbi:metallophosphoesterase [Agromyces sp. PvR057]|uniref:metallophosphoesterase n=1 Tax=Agromyces sp. PvR057 TaxID=3156403 RepID=UPI0033984002